MSTNTETNWILNLVDRISNPANKATKAAEGTQHAVDGVTAATEKMSKQSADAFEWYINGAGMATESVKKQEKEIKKLSAIDVYAIGDSFRRIGDDIDQASQPGIKFQSQLKETSAITGATGAQLDLLGEAARKTAMDFGGNAADQLESYKTVLSRLGPDIANVPDAVDSMGRSIQTLSKTMSGDAKGATDALTTAMLQYQVDLADPIAASKEMERMMNVMAAGAKYGAAEVPQIGAALEQAGVSAKLANLTFEETNAAIQAIATGGKYGAEAGTALRNVLTYISAPGTLSDDAVKILEAYHINLSKISDTTIPFAQRLRMLQPIQHDINALTEVFGRENASNAQILIRTAGDQEQLTQKITGTKIATEQAQIVMSSHEERMKRWGAWVDNLKISFFNVTSSFLPFVAGAADSISVLANLKNASDGVKTIWGALSKVTWLQTIATNALTAGQWLLNAAFVSSPIGWVVLGIGALVGAIMLAWKHFEGFRGVVMGLWETFKQVFNNIAGLFKAVFAPIGEAIQAVRNGDWKGAAAAAVKLNPVSTAARTYNYVSDGGLTKGITEAYERGAAMGRKSFQDDNKPSTTGSVTPDIIPHDSAQDGTPGTKPKILPGGKKSSSKSDGLSISGSGGRGIEMNLTIHNHFEKINSSLDIRKVADEVVGYINDRLRDAAVSI